MAHVPVLAPADASRAPRPTGGGDPATSGQIPATSGRVASDTGAGRMNRAAALLVCVIAASCSRDPAPRCGSETRRFLTAHDADYRRALARAHTWLDRLAVDPLALRAAGLKGKKKLAEVLDAYLQLWRVAPPGEQATIRERARQLARVTDDPGYHDLATVSDGELREDSTSYLRAALLMDQLGLDTAGYRAAIAAVKPRLDAHLASRGPHQRAAFRLYYRHFGLAEPFPLDDALAAGVIARRVAPAGMSTRDAYRLTHEVLVPYEFGDRMDAVDPFDDDSRAYLAGALDLLTRRAIAARDADLTAELVSCLRYLRLVDRPVYRDGLALLLAEQHADGSWGDLAEARRLFGEHAAQGRLLHSTMVAIDALTAAFHPAWNRDCR
jgi:hypothetical protein